MCKVATVKMLVVTIAIRITKPVSPFACLLLVFVNYFVQKKFFVRIICPTFLAFKDSVYTHK